MTLPSSPSPPSDRPPLRELGTAEVNRRGPDLRTTKRGRGGTGDPPHKRPRPAQKPFLH